MNSYKKINLLKLIFLNISFYVSIRMIPTIARCGWHAIFFIIVAGILFAIPIALVSAELATSWPQDIGPQVWVRIALGHKWAFVTAWLLWLETFLGIIMISSGFATLVSFCIGKSYLSKNPIFVFLVVLFINWLITLLNLSFKINKFINSLASILSIYIPYIIILLSGFWFIYRYGNVNLGPLTLDSFLPFLDSLNKFSFFPAIIFIFAGFEMSSIHANDINNPKKQYPKVIFFTISFVILFNLVAGLTEANALSHDSIQLAGTSQLFAMYFKIFKIPWLTPIFAGIISVSVLFQLRSWSLRPTKTMLQIVDNYNLPNYLKKKSKSGLPITLIKYQAFNTSLISLVYLLVPDTNIGFFMILILASLLYCIIYILILLSEIVLKYKKPTINRPFSVPGKKVGMWIIVIMAFISILIAIIFGLIPSDIIPKSKYTFYFLFEVTFTLLSIITPLRIFTNGYIFHEKLHI